MRVFVLLGIVASVAVTSPQQALAQVDDSLFVRPQSMDVNFSAIQSLADEGFQSIRVVRQQPPTVKALDRAGDEVEITIDQFDGRILSIRYPQSAARMTSVGH